MKERKKNGKTEREYVKDQAIIDLSNAKACLELGGTDLAIYHIGQAMTQIAELVSLELKARESHVPGVDPVT